jgi:hypothetical protein
VTVPVAVAVREDGGPWVITKVSADSLHGQGTDEPGDQCRRSGRVAVPGVGKIPADAAFA